MKNLIIALAAFVAVGTAHAAAFDWGGFSLNTQQHDDDGATVFDGWAKAGTTYYLVSFGATQPGTPSYFDNVTHLTDLGGTIVDQYILTQDASVNGYFGGNYGVNNTAIDSWFAIVAYDPSTPDHYAFHSFYVNLAALATDTTTFSDFQTQVDAGANAGVVPEPTSLALLALGVAAIGLRRKVK